MSANPMLTLVEVGHEVYSKTRIHGGSEYPVGGTVVEILDDVDTETGERRRAFRTVQFHGGRLRQHVLPADDVDLVNAMPFSPHRCVVLARRLAYELAQPNKRTKSGSLTTDEVELDRMQHTLIAIAIGRRS